MDSFEDIECFDDILGDLSQPKNLDTFEDFLPHIECTANQTKLEKNLCFLEEEKDDLYDVLLSVPSSPSSPHSPHSPHFSRSSTPSDKRITEKSYPGLSKEESTRLLALSVKDFNKEVKELKLSPPVVNLLKKERKRTKNRAAAFRSREKKDVNVQKLIETVKCLQMQNAQHLKTIEELQVRISKLQDKK